jgi:hypothetical protein
LISILFFSILLLLIIKLFNLKMLFIVFESLFQPQLWPSDRSGERKKDRN